MSSRKLWTNVVAVGGGLAALAGMLVTIACSDLWSPPLPPASSAGQCSTKPGEFPAANCLPFAPSMQSCTASSQACNTAPCSMTSSCLAMADNSGQSVASLRMRKLLITAPPALAFEPPNKTFVQKTVIDEGLNLQNQCGEPGTGTFNWLIQVDTTNNMVVTGGAPPAKDPFGAGYCFVNANVNGLHVGAVSAKLTKNTDGSYSSENIPTLNVPIFVASGTAGAANAPSVIILPLANSKVENVTLTENGNCIGHYNSNAVTPTSSTTCVDTDDTTCVRWSTAGSLGGHITLEAADGVDVPQLAESLCVLLAPNAPVDTSNPAEKHCARDGSGKIMTQGDFCEATNTAGGCADSFWLSATFAASAAKISATPNDPACSGETIGSGGDGGGPPVEAGAAPEAGGGTPVDAGGQ